MKKQLFKCLFAIGLCFVLLGNLYASNSGLWEQKGRIALSSDGNKHDNDDHNACMLTLMILAKAGLQPNTVLYTYADHIWGSESNDLEVMREHAEGAGQRFGFTECNFIAAVERPEDAYNAMRDAMVISTEDNPLFIIAAGPMHVIGEGINRANAIAPDALEWVTIISHSTWNEKHSQSKSHEETTNHDGWDWAMLKSNFPKVNYVDISDQNGTGEGSDAYKSKDKFSAPTKQHWDWMQTHQDPNINWIYSKAKGGDFSDAGMAYYFCANLNGVRGDEFGNPTKLKNWIGTDVIATLIDPEKVAFVTISPYSYHITNLEGTVQLETEISPATALNKNVTWASSASDIASVDETGLVTGHKLGMTTITATSVEGGKIGTASIQVGIADAGETTVGNDFISFEAESTKSDLGKWKLRKPGWAEYIEGTSGVKPLYNTYLEYTGGDENGNASGQDVLVYRFTPKTSGIYFLTGRMAQNQNGAAWDKCNDIYVKMAGDFEEAGGATKAELSNWCKLYGRGLEDWGCFVKGEPTHNNKAIMKYSFKAGEEYIFSVSGRAQRTCVDYYLFYKQGSDVKIAEKLDLATNSPEYMRPGAAPCEDCGTGDKPQCKIINAQEFTTLSVAGYDVAAKQSVPGTPSDGVNKGEPVIGCGGSNGLNQSIAAEITYTGDEGDVTFTLKTVGEPDGESTYTVWINDVKVGEQQNSKIFGTSTPAYTYQELVMNTETVALKTGDIIRVTSNQVSNGLVPEGDGFATARGRWRSISICGVEDDVTDPIVEEPVLDAHNMPVAIALATTSIQLKINYTSTILCDFAAAIKTVDPAGDQHVSFARVNGNTAGTGSFDVNLNIEAGALLEETEYKLEMWFMPPAGTWRNAFPKRIVTFFAKDVIPLALDNNGSITQVYPNPFSNRFVIESSEVIERVSVNNIAGSVLLTEQIVNSKATINTSSLPQGIFILEVYDVNGGRYTQKIIKR
ncbi:Ig-like domain-containing protein [Saccharicrinis aurantiacus]|uniref:Ig-like domain-containing protein n=1 Tax=Saccharicrinis aurantiacus TaxID=1849719 RepID=UPI0009501CEC|nr:Ig-like domain-containing protein [Saccharicrinis aurantiacus]